MKGILKLLISRRLIIVLVGFLQLGLLVFLTSQLSTKAPYIYGFLILLSVLGVIVLFDNDDMSPSYKIIWMLLMVIFPLFGGVLYLIFGNRKLTKKKAMQVQAVETVAARALTPDVGALMALKALYPQYLRHATYLYTTAGAPVYAATESTYLPDGQSFFAALCAELEKAEKFILMEYFIVHHGIMWDTILDILRRKVAQGVEVKFLYDAVGPLLLIDEDFAEQLQAMGIDAHAFNPLRFNLHLNDYMFLNHRDHRKITVIDGKVGFNGGINLADEYVNKVEMYGYWKDTAYMIKGPGVYSLTVTFSKIFQLTTGVPFDYERYRAATLPFFPAQGLVQPFDDTPLDSHPVSQDAYLNIIGRAQRYIFISTPYLVVDDVMIQGLCLAAKSGVDVRIITPGIPDKWYVYMLTQSYYKVLLTNGVRIYEYTPGFIHAKMYVSDDGIAMVGSANMDYRSLYLHFESGGMFYGGQIVRDVKDDFVQMFPQCREITLGMIDATPWWKRTLQIALRVFAPLM